MQKTYYWFDYETFGINPALDRASQFAGIRTDEDFNVIGEPLCIYCRPANDFLPSPEACMVTGITPQECLEKGLPENAFIERIHQELSQPNSCNIGYNNIRFDDEFTRHLLYRNFFDPYEHEWKNGNSRWDLLDIVRLTRALRPDGINWPTHADGTVNNTLESITQQNNIIHEQAHDALSDVYATIAVARLIKEKKPKLFAYALEHKNKQAVSELLNLKEKKIVLHVSGMIPGQFAHTAAIIPLCKHPSNNNGILVYDLRTDPSQFYHLDANELARRLFTPQSELESTRLPVKTVHINKCPVITPTSTLDKTAQQHTQISLELAKQHAQSLSQQTTFISKIQEAFELQTFEPKTDPDMSLYSGGFFSYNDKRAFEEIRNTDAQNLSIESLYFDDIRIPEMFFRYKARNHLEILTQAEQEEWNLYRYQKLNEDEIEAYFKNLDKLIEENPSKRLLLIQLSKYVQELVKSCPHT